MNSNSLSQIFTKFCLYMFRYSPDNCTITKTPLWFFSLLVTCFCRSRDRHAVRAAIKHI